MESIRSCHHPFKATEEYAPQPSTSEPCGFRIQRRSTLDHPLQPSKATVTHRKGKRKVERAVVLASLVLCATFSFFTLGHGVSAAPVVHLPNPPSPPSFYPFIERQGQAPPGTPAPSPTIDPCTTLSQVEEPDISYEHVKRCYEHVPFNATEAGIVLSTLYTLYRDYYVFLDYAMMPDQPKPFTNPPVDLLAGLDKISQTDYKSDYQFHTDIDLLVNRLNDAHANYIGKKSPCLMHAREMLLFLTFFFLFSK
ncbi:MAG: hypothetical protein BYD32DRAFT_31437 [Podila humilis]|nr:MAG: hypothetical protein BYD32DRAFT_31437 [Podila humilis]